jgi:hypothetical protein
MGRLAKTADGRGIGKGDWFEPDLVLADTSACGERSIETIKDELALCVRTPDDELTPGVLAQVLPEHSVNWSVTEAVSTCDRKRGHGQASRELLVHDDERIASSDWGL